MAKPAITTPIVDVIQVMEMTPASETTVVKQDIIAITDESADNSVYSSLAVTEPNLNQTSPVPPTATTPTRSTVSSDLATVTGTISNLRGTIYVGTAKS